MIKGGKYEAASCDDTRPGVPLVGLADCRTRPLYLPGNGLRFALSHRVGSEGRILAQTAPAPACCEGSTCHSADQSNAAATAVHHRRKTGTAKMASFRNSFSNSATRCSVLATRALISTWLVATLFISL